MKKSRLILCLLLTLQWGISHPIKAQLPAFPEGWQGQWTGTMHWFPAGATEPKLVPMALHIIRADSADQLRYTWQLQYGEAADDNRPYFLVPVDSSKGHWLIDEKNGIALDQFWLGNRLSGAFTVGSSTLLNSYSLAGDSLLVEFYSMPTAPIRDSGNGTDESPAVKSYRISGYQRAILRRKP